MSRGQVRAFGFLARSWINTQTLGIVIRNLHRWNGPPAVMRTEVAASLIPPQDCPEASPWPSVGALASNFLHPNKQTPLRLNRLVLILLYIFASGLYKGYMLLIKPILAIYIYIWISIHPYLRSPYLEMLLRVSEIAAAAIALKGQGTDANKKHLRSIGPPRPGKAS